MSLPLVDNHRHMGGSLNHAFIWDIIQKNNLYHLATSLEDVAIQMTFNPNDTEFTSFLNKFSLANKIPWTEELIEASIRSVCADIRSEGLDYCMMDFSINKYTSIGWSDKTAIKFIYDCYNKYAPNKVGLILGIAYEMPKERQKQLASLIKFIRNYVIGIDLVGDESKFHDPSFYVPIMREWGMYGKLCRAHVGESGSALNVQSAIEMGCSNIAHGFKIAGPDVWPHIVNMAIDRGTQFDMALSSNYITGVWKNRSWHPIRKLFDSGITCTIGVDDPVQLNIDNRNLTLMDEYNLLCELGFSEAEQNTIKQNAVRSANKYRLSINSVKKQYIRNSVSVRA